MSSYPATSIPTTPTVPTAPPTAPPTTPSSSSPLTNTSNNPSRTLADMSFRDETTPTIITATPVDITSVERKCIIKVVNYRKTLMCMSLIDLFFCLMNMMTFSYYFLGIILIFMGYFGAKNYHINCSRAYICYNFSSFFFKLLFFMLVITNEVSYDQSLIDPSNTTTSSSSSTKTDPHPTPPVYIYLFLMIDMLITFWIARIGYQFTHSLEYLERYSDLYERFRSGQYQVIQNQPWQREYIW